MKRQTFHLGSVLKVYELRKQRAEMELHQANRRLHEIDAQIAALGQEIAALAAMIQDGKADLSPAGWLACYRKTDQLDRRRTEVRQERERQLGAIKKCEEERKKWAIAEESLLSLKNDVDAANRAEAAKTQQIDLDEAVLRRRE